MFAAAGDVAQGQQQQRWAEQQDKHALHRSAARDAARPPSWWQVLGQGAVHGAFAGYTDFTVGELQAPRLLPLVLACCDPWCYCRLCRHSPNFKAVSKRRSKVGGLGW